MRFGSGSLLSIHPAHPCLMHMLPEAHEVKSTFKSPSQLLLECSSPRHGWGGSRWGKHTPSFRRAQDYAGVRWLPGCCRLGSMRAAQHSCLPPALPAAAGLPPAIVLQKHKPNIASQKLWCRGLNHSLMSSGEVVRMLVLAAIMGHSLSFTRCHRVWSSPQPQQWRTWYQHKQKFHSGWTSYGCLCCFCRQSLHSVIRIVAEKVSCFCT